MRDWTNGVGCSLSGVDLQSIITGSPKIATWNTMPMMIAPPIARYVITKLIRIFLSSLRQLENGIALAIVAARPPLTSKNAALGNMALG
jgi:hypothetical protein